ncbi:MAG: antitoxin [Anaerolineae bacterium]|nr:antitoxin [Anaerolineae bacterium]
MIPRYRILQERIDAELAELDRAALKVIQAQEQVQHNEQHSTFFLDSVAINLHSFYNGVERIFEWIGREIDGFVPSGPAWHRELLTQMTLDAEGVRPAVLRSETAARLEPYLRFRHLVRNLYTWSFESDKLGKLVVDLRPTFAALEADLKAFGRFLEAASNADEFPG